MFVIDAFVLNNISIRNINFGTSNKIFKVHLPVKADINNVNFNNINDCEILGLWSSCKYNFFVRINNYFTCTSVKNKMNNRY